MGCLGEAERYTFSQVDGAILYKCVFLFVQGGPTAFEFLSLLRSQEKSIVKKNVYNTSMNRMNLMYLMFPLLYV